MTDTSRKLCNAAVWQAERRGRISRKETEEIIQAMQGLNIELEALQWGDMLPLARRFERSAYDAAYLFLAQARNEDLITGDERLYNAVRSQLDWVIWIGDYHQEDK